MLLSSSWLMLPVEAPPPPQNHMMTRPTSPKYYHHQVPQNTPPPTQYTPIPNDNVDLRLAESYTPLCICLIKCMTVIFTHTVVATPSTYHIAHAICVSILLMDHISQPIRERIVHSNSMAWGVLCSFMTYPEKSTRNTSVLYAIWVITASVHILYGGVPMVHSNPSTPFWPGLRHHATPIPIQELAACGMTCTMIICIMMLSWSNENEIPTQTIKWQGIGLKTFCYLVLSSLWSYTIVIISRKGSASGMGIAKVTSILTTTRFIVVFYAPMVLTVSWSILLVVWMTWVCIRHVSMSNSKGGKRRNDDEESTQDVVEIISHLYTLDQASENIQKGMDSEENKVVVSVIHQETPPSSVVPPKSQQQQQPLTEAVDQALLAAFQAAKEKKKVVELGFRF